MICSLINLSSQLQTSRQWQLAFWNMNSNPATCSLGLEENGVGFSSQLRPPVSDAFRKSLKNLVNAGQWPWYVSSYFSERQLQYVFHSTQQFYRCEFPPQKFDRSTKIYERVFTSVFTVMARYRKQSIC